MLICFEICLTLKPFHRNSPAGQELTEECFASTKLAFATPHQQKVIFSDPTKDFMIDTTVGVVPRKTLPAKPENPRLRKFQKIHILYMGERE